MFTALGILIIPVLGLFAVFRRGRWSWRVFDDGRRPYFVVALFTFLFWVGFFASTLVGLFLLFRSIRR